MKINFSIDLTPSKALTRWALMLGVPVATLAGATLVARADVAKLVSFSPGQKVNSAQINGNFGEVKASVQALEQSTSTLQNDVAALKAQKPVAEVNGKKYSLAAVYKAATTISYDGNLKAVVSGASNGYAAAKTLCETQTGSPSAHMCTNDEIVRSFALGQAVPTGWFSTAAFNVQSSDDCESWSSSTANLGPYLTVSGSKLGVAGCDGKHPVLCCD